MSRKLVKILGYGVDTFSSEEAVDYIATHHGMVVTINPEMIEYAAKDEKFAQIINSAELVIPDGVGITVGLKILGHNVHRIPGIDFGKALLKRASKDGKTVALIGAKPEIITQAVENVKQEFPDLNIVYFHDGYFDDEDTIITEVINAKPDYVFAALGSPKQEFFINRLKQDLNKSVLIGLGGSFDVWAGAVKRAPEIYQKLGVEWLYRTLSEPKRFKRIFPTLPLFVIKVLKERVIGK